MNTYSLTSDSRRWWWPSAAAGTAAAAAVATILVLPAAGQAVPEPSSPAEPARSVFVSGSFDRQCFLLRSNWDVGSDGFQPRCPSAPVPPAPTGVQRPGLPYLP